MSLTITGVLTVITGVALIVLILLIYVRSRQGDRRVINVTNQLLLPILSAILITFNILFTYRQSNPFCTGAFYQLRYAGLALSLLLILLGIIRFFMSQSRDRRLLTHPLLFAILVITVVFLAEFLGGCL